MLTKRLIPCLDVKDNKVVKGVQFRNHEIVGEILDMSLRYRNEGADELVFYDITASSDGRRVDRQWIRQIAAILDIPFCVAGGIRSVEDAREILTYGADKISINSPALEQPNLINELAREFGRQCVVIGIDSTEINQHYEVYQYTGREDKTKSSGRLMLNWAKEVVERGAGEIVLNCMNHDGMRLGFDIKQLRLLRQTVTVPIVASGGAGALEHFTSVFQDAHVDGALAASVFHKNIVSLRAVKTELTKQGIRVRP